MERDFFSSLVVLYRMDWCLEWMGTLEGCNGGIKNSSSRADGKAAIVKGPKANTQGSNKVIKG